MRTFDEKFGAAFLSSVPPEPGVYRLYDAAGTLLYVGKAGNLRRRLAQYRTTGRRKKDRKRRRLVRIAHRIDWHTYESDLEASLTEIQLIQSLAPRENVAGAFPFLYPFIGVGGDARETRFCLTTSPEAFPSFTLHGAFRSRDVTADAFFGLMRLLRFIGHPSPRGRRERSTRVRHSYVFGYRRLPAEWPGLWNALLRGTSRAALEDLSLRLLDHAGARARAVLVQEDLRALARFFEREVRRLAAAIAATAYPEYPVPQRDRDALFLRYRERVSTAR